MVTKEIRKLLNEHIFCYRSFVWIEVELWFNRWNYLQCIRVQMMWIKCVVNSKLGFDKFSRRQIHDIFFFFFISPRILTFMQIATCMKCQSCFLWKIKKIKKWSADFFFFFFFFFTLHAKRWTYFHNICCFFFYKEIYSKKAIHFCLVLKTL